MSVCRIFGVMCVCSNQSGWCSGVVIFVVRGDGILCRGCGNWLFCWGSESGFVIISCGVRIDNCRGFTFLSYGSEVGGVCI